MSERLSQTAGETVDNTQETLLKRAMGFLSTPAGKFIGGAAIVLGAAAATKEAAADTVVCGVSKSAVAGQVEGIVRDKIGSTTEDQAVYNNNGDSNSPKVGMVDPVFFDGNILATHVVNNAYNVISLLDLTEKIGTIQKPSVVENGFIGETDLAVGNRIEGGTPTGGINFFRIEGTKGNYSYIPKGFVESSGGVFTEHGGYIFIGRQDNSTFKDMLAAIPYDVIASSQEGNNLTGQKVEIAINDGGFESGGAFFVDDSNPYSVKIIYAVKDTTQGFGYKEIEIPKVEGQIEDPSTWMENGVFKYTGVKLLKGYVDQTTGDRFFETSDGGLYIEMPGIEDPQIFSNNEFPGGIKDVTVLEDGGLYVVTNEVLSKPRLVKIGGTNGEYIISDAPDYQEGVTTNGCVAIPKAYEPDPIPEVVEVVEPSPEVFEDTGSDTDSGMMEDIPGETGSDEGTPIDTEIDQGGEDTDAGIDLGVDEEVSDDALEDTVSDQGIETDVGTDEGGTDSGTDEGSLDDGMTELPDEGGMTCETNPRLCDTIGDIPAEDVFPPIDTTVPPKDVTKDTSSSDTGVVEEGGGGGGCSSVPNGVNDTRTGVAAVMLAALAALSGSRWRRREEEVKLNK